MSDSSSEESDTSPPIAKKIKVEPAEDETRTTGEVGPNNGSVETTDDDVTITSTSVGNGHGVSETVEKEEPEDDSEPDFVVAPAEIKVEVVKKEEVFDDDDEIVRPLVRPRKDDHSLSSKIVN